MRLKRLMTLYRNAICDRLGVGTQGLHVPVQWSIRQGYAHSAVGTRAGLAKQFYVLMRLRQCLFHTGEGGCFFPRILC